MTIQLTNRMELLSWSYVEAIAAYVGVQLTKPPIDNHSVDGTLTSSSGKCPRIDFQLKSTHTHSFSEGKLSYSLPVKNYNDLKGERLTPNILILFLMPNDEVNWIKHSHDCLTMSHCAYWRSLSSEPDTTNTTSVTVEFQQESFLSPDTLKALLDKVEKGEAL